MGVYTGISQDNVRINSGVAALDNLRLGFPAIKTASFTVAENESFIVCNGAGAITVTLPTAATNAGRVLVIKTIAAQAVNSASSNVKPIATNTAGTAICAGTAGTWALLACDGTNWVVMGS